MRACLAFAIAVIVAAPAFAYDQTWYRATGWSGEYPSGFTLEADTTINIRAEPDPAEAANIACDLKAKATYHQWNDARVSADHLEFISFNKITPYRLTEAFTANLGSDPDGADVTVAMPKGERWNYLVYGAEGLFLMEYDGKRYTAGQDLVDHSEALDPAAADTAQDEWLALTCANGARGWILRADVAEKPPFGSPNITGYGTAEDAP